MKYPTLQELNTSRDMIDVFGGYNHNLRIGEGEFFDMENLTSADYPVLSPRPKRGIYKFSTPTANPIGLISKDGLCYVDGTKIVINGNHIDLGLSTDKTKCPKTLISMGAYIIIMPDKMYINTTDYDDKGKIEMRRSTSDIGFSKMEVSATLSKLDGSEYPDAPPLYAAPENPEDGQMYIDTSETPHRLRQWSETNAEWITIATTYVRLNFNYTDFLVGFNVGDGVTISGITTEGLTDLNGTTVIKEKGKTYIVITGIIDEAKKITEKVTITRLMPEMDFVIESGNRLWGCRYGFDIQGNFVNEIYASKLGDFKNWNCFDGISTDSYVATVGTDGFFTGAITHLGHPIFFKDNFMHKVYGNYPANFQVQTTACRGVQNGCSKSLAIVNETLYYKSRSAVCAYDGSLPVEVSSPLGDVAYSDAVAGTLGNKYYISMKDSEDYNLFVFDTAKGMWHREDNTQVVEFCNCRGNLYYIDYADNKIKMIRTEADEDTESGSIKWKAVTGIIGTDSPYKKYISSLVIRIKLEAGTTVRFSAEYDSSGEYEHLYTMSGTKLRSFSIPIRPKRCDHLRLKIEGQGMAKIYSICKTIEQGSDV